MLFYNYSRENYEYIGVPEEARLDPVGQQPMIPAFATVIEPPVAGENEVAVFHESSNNWSLVADLRGTVYYNELGTPTTIMNIGEFVPLLGYTTTIPPIKLEYYMLVGGNWVAKPIQDIRDMKIAQAYGNTAMVISENLRMYSAGERETWAKMNDECVEYKKSGTIGPLMTKKIATSPVYNTADKLADMTVAEYQLYIDKKFDAEAQRDHHKININSMTDVYALIDYDVSISLQ